MAPVIDVPKCREDDPDWNGRFEAFPVIDSIVEPCIDENRPNSTTRTVEDTKEEGSSGRNTRS